MRPKPRPPARLRWQPNIPIDTLEVRGNKIRYIKVGTGRTLVLLHTLRTQLDLFEKVVPDLSKRFTVYALDYLGHGYSDIPNTLYDAAFFTATVEEFLEKLDLHEITLAGISIGGAVSLIIAARHNPRVARVVAINPYDYAKGRGMARSSLFGWIVTYASLVPIVGETAMRLRSFPLMRAVLRGGVAESNSISRELQKEMYLVGNRPGHYRAFLSLLRNAESWEIAAKEYGRINVPVLLVWGDKDWARSSEREHDRRLISGVQMETVKGGGHFLALDRPQELRDLIIRFAG
jgi:pimeloyl-ACP methyl ester carboxylesterase